jgi:CxxC-x17-CxxC domain-containing protein
MGYQDKSIQCSDCGNTFTFSAEEQEQFASRGYTNDPKRCQSCRETRKSRNSGNGGNRGYGYKAPREMFDAVCAQCGKDTRVPFEPRSGRPVYCSNCYNQVRSAR